MQKDGGTSISKYTQEDVKSLKRERKMGTYHINIYTGFGMCVCRLVHVNAKNNKKTKNEEDIQREREREDSVFYALLRLAAKGLDSSSSFLSYLLTDQKTFLSFSLCYSATVYSVRLLHIRDRSGRRIGRDFLSDQKKK